MGDSQRIKRIDLTGVWEFRNFKSFKNSHEDVLSQLRDWMPATVPGTVHTDLMALDKIPDPFYRDNELRVQWVSEGDWEYRKTFQVDEAFLRSRRVDLVCEGLDTYATIMINSTVIAKTANMFIGFRFEVGQYLREGKNEIRIQFASPLHTSKVLEKKHGPLPAVRQSHRVFSRKAQYSFGWDWGPCLPTSGIWRSIHLEAIQVLRLSDIHIQVQELSETEAILDINIEVDKVVNGTYTYRVEAEQGGEGMTDESTTNKNSILLQVAIPNPQLWWPRGYGDPYLYDFRIFAFSGDEEIDSISIRFGIRRIELQLKDDDGSDCFRLHINGTPIFCKGADWIPADSFLPRVSPHRYEKLLMMAKDAHMNMLRVWGGGIYEDPEFYTLCDKLGIMVWQDFMFACGSYPEEKWFTDAVRDEVETVVKRLRNHASVVLWCGNNENEWIWYREPEETVEDMKGFPIFHDLIPEICRTLDSSRPYWPTSPWGGKDPNDEKVGNHHSWEIWSQWVDYTEVTQDRGNFITEFGFQAPPSVDTLERYLEPEDFHPQSRMFTHHEKQEEGIERLFRFLAGHQNVTVGFFPFIYACQVNQAEALKTCIEHWRRRKFKTAGALIWQLNDCWPVISWSLIDSEENPKASYYYARRFFSDILLSYEKRKDGLVLWGVNDTLNRVVGVLDVTVRSFDGIVKLSNRWDMMLPPNASMSLCILDDLKYDKLSDRGSYIRAVFRSKEGILAQSCYLFDRLKFLDLRVKNIEASYNEKSDGTGSLVIHSERYMKSVYLHHPGWLFDDNFFNVYPGEMRTVVCRPSGSDSIPIKNVTILSVGNYEPIEILWKK